MRKTAAILFMVVLAIFITPLRLPAASCILSNAPSQEACKPNCCANMACCAVSEKNTGPVSQPLVRGGTAKQVVIALVATMSPNFFSQSLRLDRVAGASGLVRAHSPPPLTATCIRLI
jgi:hypothetical protein